MASSFTTNLGLEKPANGDYVDTWDIPVNGNMDIVDKFKGGTVVKSLTNSNVTLTKDEMQNLRIALNGTLTANVSVFLTDNVAGSWIVDNGTSGAFTVTVRYVAGGTSIVAPQSKRAIVMGTGTNVNFADDRVVPTSEFDAGTRIVFHQTLAPTGWVKDSTPNNRGLRFTSGTAGYSPDGYSFDDLFSFTSLITITGTVGGTSLTPDQLANHTHLTGSTNSNIVGSDTLQNNPNLAFMFARDSTYSFYGRTPADINAGPSGGVIGGTGNPHSHTWSKGTVNMKLAYASCIIAQKS